MRLDLRRLGGILLALLLVGCGLADRTPDRSLDDLRAAGRLRVGIDPSYPPFDFVDGNQQLAGFDVDLARELARRLDVEVDFVPIDVGTIFDGLMARRYDLIVSALPPAPELSKDVAFSSPYFNAGQVLVVPETSDLSPAALVGRPVAVEMGTGGEAALRPQSGKPGPSVHVYESAAAALAAVQRREADGAVIDVLTALEMLPDHPDLRLVGPPIGDEPYVVAARARNRALLAAVEGHLRTLKSEGFVAGLEQRWLVGLPGNWQ